MRLFGGAFRKARGALGSGISPFHRGLPTNVFGSAVGTGGGGGLYARTPSAPGAGGLSPIASGVGSVQGIPGAPGGGGLTARPAATPGAGGLSSLAGGLFPTGQGTPGGGLYANAPGAMGAPQGVRGFAPRPLGAQPPNEMESLIQRLRDMGPDAGF